MNKHFKKTNAKKYLLFYLPFIMVLGIVPLIVKMAVRENPLQGVAWYSQGQTIVDFFLYWKSIILIVSAAVMVILFFCYMADRGFRLHIQDSILVPVLILTFFEIASSLFTVNSKTTLHGMPDQFESIWVILAYTVCLVYAYMCVSQDIVRIEVITCMMLVCALPIELICVGQTFGRDIFRYIYNGQGYTFNMALGEAYGTFYNKNYVGSYAILLIPCFIVAAICVKKVWIKVVAIIETVMLLISLYGSASSTGIIAGVVVSVICVVVLLVRKIPVVKYRKAIFFLSILFVVVLGVVLGKGKIENYLASCDTEQKDFDYVITGADDIEFGFRQQTYHLNASYVEGEGLYILLLDNDMQNIVLHENQDEGGYYYASDESRLEDLKIRYILVSQNPDVHGIELGCGNNRLYFSNEVLDCNGYYYLSPAGSWTKLLKENQSKDFEPLNKLSGLANGRGYLWNKTIAILPNYILFGSGADTFACVYPNDDYIGNMNNGYSGLIVTKPHNMYLQYAVQSGILSLLCLLVLFFWYILKNLNLILLGSMKSFEERSNFAMFLGFVGYMVTGLTNDSTITVAPVFWMLFGIGLALTNRIKLQQ